MKEEKKIATRQSYGEALAELGKKNENIVVLDADLSSATKTNIFAEKFPDRFINVGIAEQNLMGIAAGLAAYGKVPFVSTFAIFAAGRAYDQIRNSICYPKLNVKVCATHAGLTVGEDGATHQMLEDLSMMRTLPNMAVFSPSDDIQTKWLIEEIAKICDIKTISGEIDIEKVNLENNSKIETKSGDVEISKTDSYIVTETTSGETRTSNNNRYSKTELYIKTISGDITAE